MSREKLVIDRNIWLRGTANSLLLRTSDGKRCCLGIYLGMLGLKDEELAGRGMPVQVARAHRVPGWLVQLVDGRIHATLACRSLAIINDDACIIEEQREREVAMLFAQNGVDVKFIN